MKKKIIYVLCILGVLLVLLGLKKRNDTMYSSGVYHLNRSGIVESIENNNIVVRLDKLNEQDESIYARGKSGGVITTKDIEQATEFYILAGYEQSDAEDKAVEYMLQRDATYQRAIAVGYSVSDDEINDYLDDLKVTINDSINSEEAQALISQFGSEEGYWQHEFEVYKINLPIEKYLESLKQEYLQNSISTQSNNQEAEETIENYNRYIEEVQSELVKQEQYEIFE